MLPPTAAPPRQLITTNCLITDIVVGDFSQLVIGIKQDAKIEVSGTAGTAFEKNQIRVRITVRLDIHLLRGDHFNKLTGITT